MLKEVLRCVPETPAKVMNMEGKIGTLKPGAFADVAIFKMIDKKAIHKDARMKCLKLINCLFRKWYLQMENRHSVRQILH